MAATGQLGLGIGSVGSGGPVALVTAGIHGDEGPWGAWAIRQLLEMTTPDELLGTLRVVPVANPLAMESDTRNAAIDQLDLNRSFPGSATGSYTERVAAALVAHALPGAETVIDLHGGGSWCVNAFAFQFEGGEALSQAFGAPFIVNGPDRNVTLTGYARHQGAQVAAIEMGGRSQYEADWAKRIATGLRRTLGVAGVLKPYDVPAAESLPVGPSTVLRPASGGVFMPRVGAESVGTLVPGGTVLGEVVDPVTQATLETFVAPFPQTALMLLRPMIARIEGGAMTYVVAEPKGP
jgi:predicted deacylase